MSHCIPHRPTHMNKNASHLINSSALMLLPNEIINSLSLPPVQKPTRLLTEPQYSPAVCVKALMGRRIVDGL